jgi:hypothetical protein
MSSIKITHFIFVQQSNRIVFNHGEHMFESHSGKTNFKRLALTATLNAFRNKPRAEFITRNSFN